MGNCTGHLQKENRVESGPVPSLPVIVPLHILPRSTSGRRFVPDGEWWYARRTLISRCISDLTRQFGGKSSYSPDRERRLQYRLVVFCQQTDLALLAHPWWAERRWRIWVRHQLWPREACTLAICRVGPHTKIGGKSARSSYWKELARSNDHLHYFSNVDGRSWIDAVPRLQKLAATLLQDYVPHCINVALHTKTTLPAVLNTLIVQYCWTSTPANSPTLLHGMHFRDRWSPLHSYVIVHTRTSAVYALYPIKQSPSKWIAFFIDFYCAALDFVERLCIHNTAQDTLLREDVHDVAVALRWPVSQWLPHNDSLVPKRTTVRALYHEHAFHAFLQHAEWLEALIHFGHPRCVLHKDAMLYLVQLMWMQCLVSRLRRKPVPLKHRVLSPASFAK